MKSTRIDLLKYPSLIVIVTQFPGVLRHGFTEPEILIRENVGSDPIIYCEYPNECLLHCQGCEYGAFLLEMTSSIAININPEIKNGD
jgi:hypothetical protein